MRSEDVAQLSNHVVVASVEALNVNGVAVVEGGPNDHPDDERHVAAFIGYVGSTVRGTMTLVAPESLLHACYPLTTGREADPADLFDWWGEVVNHVLGRLKNRLLREGVEIQASTPKTMYADNLYIKTLARVSVCTAVFRAGDSVVKIWFDAVANSDAALFESSAPTIECAPEGDLILF